MLPNRKILALVALVAAIGASLIPLGPGDQAKAVPSKIRIAESQQAPVEIGEVIPAERLHIVSHPGRYGLGPELPGSNYAVVDGKLIRIDAETHRVQSIIRNVTQIVD